MDYPKTMTKILMLTELYLKYIKDCWEYQQEKCPEIPANTGNIGRAGMDYWQHLDVTGYMNFQEFREMHPGAKIWMATTKAHQTYTDVKFGPDDYIMFGKESAGIPEEILVEHEETCIHIPMLPEIRSLNHLSNSVAIVLYEALRQQGFESMQRDGELHRLHWKES